MIRIVQRSAGWRIRRTRSGHLQVFPPNGKKFVTIAGTPGRFNRSMENTLARLRAAGLNI